MFFSTLFIISFILNFVWENLHKTLYLSNTLPFSGIALMLYASFVDAFLILFIYLLTSPISRNWIWKINIKSISIFSLVTIIVAILIEVRALLTGRWLYKEIMPTVFEIGLTPLIQLAITGIVSIILVKKLFVYYRQ